MPRENWKKKTFLTLKENIHEEWFFLIGLCVVVFVCKTIILLFYSLWNNYRSISLFLSYCFMLDKKIIFHAANLNCLYYYIYFIFISMQFKLQITFTIAIIHSLRNLVLFLNVVLHIEFTLFTDHCLFFAASSWYNWDSISTFHSDLSVFSGQTWLQDFRQNRCLWLNRSVLKQMT